MSKKQRFHIRNWRNYNEALVNRGSITFWFDDESIRNWYAVEKTGQRGRPKLYADMAIQCVLTIREIFRLPLRGTEGFIRSLIDQMQLPIQVPDYTTLCIRQKELPILLPKVKKTEGKSLNIVVDATGLKVFGEGEWKVRQHGHSKRRTWRKLHLAINTDNHEIEAAVVSTNDFKDSQFLPDLLEQIHEEIDQVSGDGAYDSKEGFHYITDKGARATIPPRKNAVIEQHGNSKCSPLPRDEIIRSIRKVGRRKWKQQSGYHKRNLAETAIYRLKTIFNDTLRSRNFEHQATEALLRCRALNKMTQLGMPDSYIIK